MANNNRIAKRFAALDAAGRKGLVTFVTAGDPNLKTSRAILSGLALAGADFIELGMPFSDPMADGPAIQLANQRALGAGMTLAKTLVMVKDFRKTDDVTPVILMGYYNPIYHYGVDRFVSDAVDSGVDGLIIVDLPPEEDNELCHPASIAGIDWIRLTTPTSDDKRLPTILKQASGFVYYVSIAGVTGTASAAASDIANAVARIKRHTGLPIAVGFGIKTAAHVAETVQVADAAVVGSAIVNKIAECIEDGASAERTAEVVHAFVAELASGCR